MLRLEKMEICGFKSFGDRTEILFPEGITAIVGPNGCGKSNIGDAINWVLGEQSAKQLRGHQMADVIFSGSDARKPLGMAEVSLIFGGAEGMAHNDQGQVVVTRRLFRSGESEYQMNGARTRLKDIQELLRSARVGARTYATIEQGKIDQVLNAKPRDRRALIEDAAGISGYKHKRRLAELKLEATKANLLRVNDIVVEVQRQINSLKRQAAKARRYRRLRDELRAKELLRFASQARELEEELDRRRAAEASARDAEAAAAAQLAKLEAGLQQQRDALEQADRSCREAAEKVHQLELEIDREETQVGSCRERIAESDERAGSQHAEADRLEAKHEAAAHASREHGETVRACMEELERLNETLVGEQAGQDEADRKQADLREQIETFRGGQFEAMARAAELRNRLRNSEEALERIAGRRSRIESEQAETRDALTKVRSESTRLAEEAAAHRADLERQRAELLAGETRLEQARERQSGDVESLSAAREGEKSALARLRTLEDVETRFAGVSDGVKRLLRAGTDAGIRTHGVVADYVQASREVEGAAEGYLQWLLPTVILEDEADVHRAAQLLRAQGAGRTSLICRNHPGGKLAVGTPGNGHSPVPREILEDRRVLGRLKDRLKLNAAANGAVAERIGDAVIVDNLETALDLHRRYPETDYLTPQGEVVYASGVIAAGGRAEGDQGLLAHRRQMDETRDEASRATERVAQLRRNVDAVQREVVELEAEIRVRREQLEQTERAGVELEIRVQRSREETERSDRRSAVLAEELAGLLAEAGPLEQSRQQLGLEATEAERTQQALEASLKDAMARAEQAELDLRQRQARVTELRAEQGAKQQRAETVTQEGRRLEETAAELKSRLDGLRSEASAAEGRAADARRLLEETERSLVAHLEQRKARSATLENLEREIAERREKLSTDESGLGTVRAELEGRREGTREAELARARAESAREHLDDLCRQELGVPVAEVELEDEQGEPPPEIDLEALEAEIDEIKDKIERIGPVNMTAIEEFSELDERYSFLTTQRDDLEKSMESLKEAIRRINRESRQRFVEAFEQIRASYQEVYRLLFNGGRADLRLEEGEDVLECGIDILAQPPGKRLTGVHLLSGGEKALSAIALLFAIFRYQPSPFCLLDEVDAALDDANVGRFARMVGEYAKNTQFVIITHNKLSMEAANLLYGVTMEEPGVSKLMSLELG